MVLIFVESDLGKVKTICGGVLSTGPPPGIPFEAHWRKNNNVKNKL
jgi:hypothetical protein